MFLIFVFLVDEWKRGWVLCKNKVDEYFCFVNVRVFVGLGKFSVLVDIFSVSWFVIELVGSR